MQEYDTTRFASKQKEAQYVMAWAALDEAIVAEEAGDMATVIRKLSAACHRELDSLGFQSTLVGQYNDIKLWCTSKGSIRQLN